MRLADEAAEKARLEEEARLAEEARIAEEKRLADEADEKARLEEEARLAEEARIAEEKRLADEAAEKARLDEEARLAEEARIAEEKRLAEEARIAEEKRLAEEARIAELTRLVAELERLASSTACECVEEEEEEEEENRRGEQDVSLEDLVKIDINNDNTILTTKHDGRYGTLEGVLTDDGDEFLWTDQGPDTWIIADFKGVEQTFVGIGIKSAPADAPEDPKTVVISVPKEEGSDEWVEIATVTPVFNGKRLHLVKFVIPKTTTTKMKFDFNNGDMNHGQ